MSGVLLTAHGGPEVLVWSDAIPLPRPAEGEVLVRVLAAGINNTDINTRIGWYASSVTGATEEGVVAQDGGWAGALDFPRIQGADLCGEVVALGAGVTALALGARVIAQACQPTPTADAPTALRTMGSECDGAFAHYCVVPERYLYDVTASPLTTVELAALPCAFGTAEAMLTRANVGRGDRVLVTGASGGVGMAAVQLAHGRGAIVTAITAPSKAQAVREAGASAILDRDAAPAKDAFDVVIEVVGGAGWSARLESLRAGGRMVVSGAIAGPMVETDLRRIYLHDLSIYGSTYQPAETFAHLVELALSGAVRPLVSKTYPLSNIAEAQADFITKRYAGKLVLIPSQEPTP